MSAGRAGSAVAVALAVVACAGCDSGDGFGGGDAREGGSIVVGLARAPDSMDPAVAASPEALGALWLTNTPLLTYARKGGNAGTRLVPGLAENAPEPSRDGLTYRLTLRKGLRYSDGRRVRAADFGRAVRRARALNPLARRAMAGIEEITTGGRRIRIDLSEPDPELPYVLAAPWAAPVPAGTKARELRSVPGVGPYEPGPRDRGVAYALTRRRSFELPGVPGGNVDLISGRVVRTAAARTAEVIDGRLDIVQGEPPVPLLPEIRSKYEDRYSEHRTLALRYVELDLNRRPFRDKDLRRAVAFSLDERTLARLEDGFLSPSCNVLPPAVPGYEVPDPCPFGEREGNADLPAARELVEGSRDAGAKVLVDGGEGPRAAALARYGVETLDKIGLRARRASNARERAGAQLRFVTRLPAVPHPARYLEAVDDPAMESRVALLELAGPPRSMDARWAALDHEVVSDALIAPYGVTTTGAMLSERLDAANCERFHPLYGIDLSSLCVR